MSEKEKGVLAALETALEVFYELRNDRQAAATHYQLGSFYSNYWPLCLTENGQRSDAVLEKAMLHYREAHGYYSKYDVGPTLILILVDMCDLYLAAFTAQECFLKGTQGKGTTAATTATTTTTTTTTAVTAPPPPTVTVTATTTAANDDNSIVLENDLISALLGGALQSLLDSRFAFTPAVAIRSRYRDQIGALLMPRQALMTPLPVFLHGLNAALPLISSLYSFEFTPRTILIYSFTAYFSHFLTQSYNTPPNTPLQYSLYHTICTHSINIGSLAGDVARRLGAVLMKLLRARAMGYMMFTEQRSSYSINTSYLYQHALPTPYLYPY